MSYSRNEGISTHELHPLVSNATNINFAHTLDNNRRSALAEIDNAKFSLFHIKVGLVAGVGFFTAAYDIFAISIASTILGYIYGSQIKRDSSYMELTQHQELGLKVATPVGTFIGQIVFGWLADIVGRKRMYGVELIIIIVATFGQAVTGGARAVNAINVLAAWRFILGIGIGGDYPLSAVISSEFSSTRTRGRLMTGVFAAQGWGNFAAALVAFIIIAAYKKSLSGDLSDQLDQLDQMWRLLIGLGCVPGAIALYFRLTIPETPRFTMDIDRNVKQATEDIKNVLSRGKFVVDPDAVIQRVRAPKATRRDFFAHFSQWRNLKVLIGTSYSWFALDIAFYGLGLNTNIILQAIKFGDSEVSNSVGISIYEDLKNISLGNLVLSVAGLIPGYYASLLFIDSWGRKPIQLMGFAALTIILAIMGFGYDKLVTEHQTASKGFVVFYCLANFFFNFGPNVTTFVIPGEVFPTRYRSTCHGISAASGKLGAIIAQVCFDKLKDINGPNHFIKHILEIFSFVMLTGVLSTLLLPESMQRTLEDLSNENQEGFINGIAGDPADSFASGVHVLPLAERR